MNQKMRDKQLKACQRLGQKPRLDPYSKPTNTTPRLINGLQNVTIRRRAAPVDKIWSNGLKLTPTDVLGNLQHLTEISKPVFVIKYTQVDHQRDGVRKAAAREGFTVVFTYRALN